jgi:hypothetical protein
VGDRTARTMEHEDPSDFGKVFKYEKQARQVGPNPGTNEQRLYNHNLWLRSCVGLFAI